MMIRREINLDAPLTEAQKQMLEALKDRPVQPDEDCPELTAEQLSQMVRVSEQRREERMVQDPEYAEEIRRKKDEQNKARSARRKAEREALIERARTDPEAATVLEAIRAKQRAASERSRQKKLACTKADSDNATVKRTNIHGISVDCITINN